MARPRLSTWQLGYAVRPGPDHPDRETHGEALVVCWIRAARLDRADEVARAHLSDARWQPIEREQARRVTRADFQEDDELLGYFEQAQVDQEVYLFHLSPRFPAYRVVARVRRPPAEVAEAHYFVAGEALSRSAEELWDPGFWSKARATRVETAAREDIAEAGWELVELTAAGPIDHASVADDLKRFYDQAEEHGSCLVFVRAPGPARTRRRR